MSSDAVLFAMSGSRTLLQLGSYCLSTFSSRSDTEEMDGGEHWVPLFAMAPKAEATCRGEAEEEPRMFAG